MTGKSLGIRTSSYGSLQLSNGAGLQLQTAKSSIGLRKPCSKMLFSGSKEKERSLPFMCCRYLGRRRVSMLMLMILALGVFVYGSYTVNKESTSPDVRQQIHEFDRYNNRSPRNHNFSSNKQKVKGPEQPRAIENFGKIEQYLLPLSLDTSGGSKDSDSLPLHHPCENFTVPPPPPPGSRRVGPRPCPVCYLSVEQAIASMPSTPSSYQVLNNLTYVRNENPVKAEPHGGSEFGGYPSLKQRKDSFDIKESMKVHCGFVKGSKPGRHTGFDIDEDVLMEMEQFHEVIVASAIFGNYDLIQEPQNISEAARNNIPFYMFVDEDTEAYIKNTTSLSDNNTRLGLWRIVVVRNVPYYDARRNGKVPKLLLHRIFPNVRYSIWIDGKLQLVVDPYQVLERFLWRSKSSFAISRHYRRFDVFEEAEANKAARKYDNDSIDSQMEFYKNEEGLTPYSVAKLPITSDVPEGCVIIREHLPVTNLFTCLWFNEVDRFTSRDQLSFSTVRDKIMARVNWTINMFMDCERRNFVIQVYHRDVMMNRPPIGLLTLKQPALPLVKLAGRNPTARKLPSKHGRDRRSGSRRHRKVAAGRESNSF